MNFHDLFIINHSVYWFDSFIEMNQLKITCKQDLLSQDQYLAADWNIIDLIITEYYYLVYKFPYLLISITFFPYIILYHDT